jgi:UDP-glucose 4-epimerase
MRLLITGVAGFIGSQIAKKALEVGHEVIGIDNLSTGYEKNVPKGAKFEKFNLANSFEVKKLPKVDVIMHLAGQSSGEISFDSPQKDLKKNTLSTLNLIEYGIKNNVRKIIYASSMSVYGDVPDGPIKETVPCLPLSCYGVGKLASENYLSIYGNALPYTTFRMFNVYGPGQDLSNLRQGMASIYISYALNNKCIPVKGSLYRFRDFIYIDDVVNIWLQAIEERYNNQIFNLGSGKKTSVFNLLEIIKSCISNCQWKEREQTLGDQFGIYADISLLKEKFNIKNLTDVSEGMNKFISWSKTNHE